MPRSSLPMRGPPSDQSQTDEVRCSISSDASGRLLVTSLPPISHPVSARPIPESLYLFEGFDSENTGSAVAHVGRAPSPVAPSQKTQNDRWRSWLEQPSSVISSHIAIEGSRGPLEHRASPGISEIHRPERDPGASTTLTSMGHPVPSDLDEASPTQETSKLPSSSDSSQILSRYEELVSRLRRLEQSVPPECPLLTKEDSIDMSSENNGLTQSFPTKAEIMMSPCADGDDDDGKLGAPIEGIETEKQHSATPNETESCHADCAKRCSRQPLAAAQRESTQLDLDDAWKSFVFGSEDSDEVGKAAFDEARHDAARKIVPSDSPRGHGCHVDSELNSNIATIGTMYATRDSETSESAESASPVETSAKTTYGPSSTGTDRGPATDSSEGRVGAPSVEVNPGSSVRSGFGSPDNSDGNTLHSPGNAEESSASDSRTGPRSTTTSMAVVPARSDAGASESATPGEQFRFVPPKLFVGSRSNSSHMMKRGTESGVGISLTKRRRGRPRKRANDGRADIRALPNYSSDPIEEFEDEERPRQSIFPALELA